MIKLSKRDIRTVAESWYMRKNFKRFIIGTVGWVAMFLGIMLPVQQLELDNRIEIAIMGVLAALLIAGMAYWFRQQEKYTKGVLGEAERGDAIVYDPELKN